MPCNQLERKCLNGNTFAQVGTLYDPKSWLIRIPVMALDALVLLGLLDDDDLVDAALAGSGDGAEVQHLMGYGWIC